MTELVSAIEKVRENLPHTRERFKKQTYRQMLMVKKRERDLADKLKKHRQAHNSTNRVADGSSLVRKSLSQSSVDDLMCDSSRVVTNILPRE